MKILTRAIAVAVGVCGIAVSAHAGSIASANGRYLVVFKSDTLPADARIRIAANGGAVTRTLDHVGVVIARGDAGFVKRMKQDTKVLAVGAEQVFAQPDVAVQELSADTGTAEAAPTAADWAYFQYQWDMRRIGAPAVWARLPLSANSPRVAVLDTGVMNTHPDLAGQVDASVSTAYCSTPGPGGAAGYPIYTTLIDLDAHPNWSPADGCAATFTTYESHGTHVAGTIAAKLGAGAVVGVAPDAKVGAYKVFDRYRYTDADGVHDVVGAFDGPVFTAIVAATEAGYPA
jgi:subtilisin family serine protease